MKKTMTIANKEELLKVRKTLKEKGFTEAKLLYRAGKYVLTYFESNISKLGLMELGFIKKDEEYKKTKEKFGKVLAV